MATSQTFLQKVGTFFKKIFGIATAVATDIEPLVAVAFPSITSLYETTVSMVAQAEMAATAAGNQSGSGPQKLAAVVTAITPVATSLLAKDGVAVNSTHVTNWVSAVVATLNSLPAPATTTPPTTLTVPATTAPTTFTA